jgi:hypothetical protein
MTLEEQILLLSKTKEQILDMGISCTHENHHIDGPVYNIVIPVEVWHRIFKTEEAKKLGLYGG